MPTPQRPFSHRLPITALAAFAAACPLAPPRPAAAASPRTLSIGLSFATSGLDAPENQRMREAAALALDQANAAHTIPGIALAPLDLDETAAGQSDPTRAAANARAFVANPAVIAVIGPSTSLAARAMLPIFNAAGLAAISPSATEADLTASSQARLYRPSYRLTFFRTAAPDQAQGAAIAAYWAATAHPATAAIVEDGSASGAAVADGFAAAAPRHAIHLVARARLAPTTLAALQAAAPAAILYAGNAEAGLAFLRQAAPALPHALKASGDGLYGPELLTALGFPAAEGLVIAVGQPHLAGPAAQSFARAYLARTGAPPDDASLAAYDAATALVLTLKSLAATAKPLTRDTLRAALAKTPLATAQGPLAFDLNGDPKPAPITLYQAHQNPSAPPDSMAAQLRLAPGQP